MSDQELATQESTEQQAQSSNDPKLIEGSTRLLDSKLWELQRRYFTTMGIKAWEDDVPFYVSNNAFIGHQYAELIYECIKDLKNNNKLGKTVTILELGCGTGKFGYYFIKSILSMLNHGLSDVSIRYVMSDVSDKNVDFCHNNPSLKPFIDDGKIDFAIFNAETDKDFKLQIENKNYSECQQGPLIIIANYIFDCLRHDYLKWDDEKYLGLKVALKSRFKDFDQKEVRYLKDLRIYSDFEPIDIEDAYTDQNLIQILNKNKSDLMDKKAIMPIPLATFEFFHNIKALTNDNAILLLGDKGVSLLETFSQLNDRYQMTFEGCYTFLLNYYLLAQYIKQMGGDSLLTEKNNEFQVCLYSFGHPFNEMPNTHHIFNEQLDALGPQEYVSLVDQAYQNSYRYSAKAIISFLRLSHWDPDMFAVVFDKLLDTIKSFSEYDLVNIELDIKKIENNIYHLDIGHNVNNLLGMLYQELEQEDKAIYFYERALTIFENQEAPFHNLGLVYEVKKDKAKAIEYYEKAFKVNKHNKFAKRKIDLLKGNVKTTILGPLFRASIVIAGIGAMLYFLIMVK